MRDSVPSLTAAPAPSHAPPRRPAEDGPPDDAFAAMLGSVHHSDPPPKAHTPARTAHAEGQKPKEDDASRDSTQSTASSSAKPADAAGTQAAGRQQSDGQQSGGQQSDGQPSAGRPSAADAQAANGAATAAASTGTAVPATSPATPPVTAGATPPQAAALPEVVPAGTTAPSQQVAAVDTGADDDSAQPAEAGTAHKQGATAKAGAGARWSRSRGGQAGDAKAQSSATQPARATPTASARPAAQTATAASTGASSGTTQAAPSAATSQQAAADGAAPTTQAQPTVALATDGSARASGSNATRPAAAPEPLEAHARMQDVVDVTRATMRMATRGGNTQARIIMHPEDLGEVQVRLTYHDGGVTASVTADSSAAARALALASHDLRRSLEAQGVTVHAVDVQLANRDGGSEARRDRALDLASAMGSRGADDLAVDDEHDTPIEPARLSLAGSQLDVLA